MKTLAALVPVALVCMCYSPASISAQHAERLELKSIRLGISEQEFRAEYPDVGCHTTGYPASLEADRRCAVFAVSADRHSLKTNSLLDIVGYQADIFSAHFIADKLVLASAYLTNDAYEATVGALRVKYGKEAFRRAETMQNAFGATYRNEIITWPRGQQLIEVRKHYEQPDKMFLRLFSVPYLADVQRRTNDRARKAAGGL